MTFVTARDLRLHPAQVWGRLAKNQELIITLKGRPVGILAKVSSDDVEEVLHAFRRARGALAVSHLRAEARAAGADRLSGSEIEREISAVRRRRRPANRE